MNQNKTERKEEVNMCDDDKKEWQGREASKRVECRRPVPEYNPAWPAIFVALAGGVTPP